MNGDRGKLTIVLLFALAVAGAFAFLFLRKGAPTEPVAQPETSSGSAPSAAAPPAVTVRFLYGTEKKAWLREAVQAFEKSHPSTKVELVEAGSLQSAADMLDGKERPTLYSPANAVALNLLANDWSQKNGKALFASSGEDAPVPLVLSPLVLVGWEERVKLLVGKDGALGFRELQAALDNPKNWPAFGGKSEWGFVKLGQTNPTKSNSGLQALILMAYEFHNKQSGLAVSDVLDEKFQAFVRSIQKGVSKFGDSTGSFMEEMVLYGPSKYDLVVSYESLAIQHLANAQGRWGNLRVFYPRATMWSSHPVVLLDTDWVQPAQKQAARELVRFLRERPQQEQAERYGFRPANPEVPIRNDPASPFAKAADFGVRIDIPPVVEPPDGPVIRNLMEMWSRWISR